MFRNVCILALVALATPCMGQLDTHPLNWWEVGKTHQRGVWRYYVVDTDASFVETIEPIDNSTFYSTIITSVNGQEWVYEGIISFKEGEQFRTPAIENVVMDDYELGTVLNNPTVYAELLSVTPGSATLDSVALDWGAQFGSSAGRRISGSMVRGESVQMSLRDPSGNEISDSDAILLFSQPNWQSAFSGGPNDWTISVTANVNMEVGLPGVGKVNVGVSVTVTGPARDAVAMIQMAQQLASNMADSLSQEVKEKYDELSQKFKEWIETGAGWPWFWLFV